MGEKKSLLGLACKVLAAPPEENQWQSGKNNVVNNVQTIAFVNV